MSQRKQGNVAKGAEPCEGTGCVARLRLPGVSTLLLTNGYSITGGLVSIGGYD